MVARNEGILLDPISYTGKAMAALITTTRVTARLTSKDTAVFIPHRRHSPRCSP